MIGYLNSILRILFSISILFSFLHEVNPLLIKRNHLSSLLKNIKIIWWNYIHSWTFLTFNVFSFSIAHSTSVFTLSFVCYVYRVSHDSWTIRLMSDDVMTSHVKMNKKRKNKIFSSETLISRKLNISWIYSN